VVLAFAVFVSVVGMQPAVSAPSHGRTVDGRVSDWHGASTRLGGTWQYSAGELVYQDHIYDDLGADTRQRSQQYGVTGPASGDYRYPTNEERYGNNAADLLELRFAADREALWVLARMNTLKVRDATVVAIGIDSDAKASTGGGTWPYAAGFGVPGVDRVITLWGTGGTVTKLPGGSVTLRDVAVDASNDHNAIEARIPRSTIGSGRKLRVWAATGLWDAANKEWVAPQPGNPSASASGGGSPAITARAFNVAFRDNETGSYMEELQAAALSAGDISRFHADIDLGALAGGASRPYKIQTKRFYVAVMDQRITIPPYNEGSSYTGVAGRFTGAGGALLTQKFTFYGRHQPYGVYIPSTYGRRARIPAALALHGHGGSHSTYNSQPGFLRDMGEGAGTNQPPMFLITPLARGSSFYADWGEADTLAVLDDVFARFPIDRERLYLTGYSMGGYGVYRLASLYPDRFAAAAVWAGYTGEFLGTYATNAGASADPTGVSETLGDAVRPAVAGFGIGGGRAGKATIGNPVDTLENLQYLPLVHLAGTNDQLVPVTGQYAAPRRLAELGYTSRFDLYPGYEHLTFALVDDWKQVRTWLGNAQRPSAVRQITYKFSDGWTAKGLASQLKLKHGNAWWLRAAKMRKTTNDALDLATVSVVSGAIPARRGSPVSTVNPSLAPTPHTEHSVSFRPSGSHPVSNRLDVVTRGVGSLTIDVERARLEPCGLRVVFDTDAPLTLLLAGSAGSRVLHLPRSPDGALRVRCSR
jgi:poly(3-hydroxybutyrate) depolymerase